MQIIPVIDLKRGLVVHARRGDRASYCPIETPLSPTAMPTDVVAGLMRLAPFAKLYVADLDAISGAGDHRQDIRRLKRAYPALDIWTDRGTRDHNEARLWLDAGLGSLVLGSESQADCELVAAHCDDDRVVLSLDFRGDAFQGPHELLADASVWPARVIVMTLARVGSNEGPDFERVASIVARAGGRDVFAAGGLRTVADGQRLKEIGVAGVLAASALHGGALGPEDIFRLN